MNRNTPRLVDVARDHQSPSASRAPGQYHTLIRKIDRRKQLPAVWGEAVPLYQRQRASEYEPLRQTYPGYRADLVGLFDHAAGQPAFTRRDRRLSSNASRGPSGRRAWHP